MDDMDLMDEMDKDVFVSSVFIWWNPGDLFGDERIYGRILGCRAVC